MQLIAEQVLGGTHEDPSNRRNPVLLRAGRRWMWFTAGRYSNPGHVDIDIGINALAVERNSLIGGNNHHNQVLDNNK